MFRFFHIVLLSVFVMCGTASWSVSVAQTNAPVSNNVNAGTPVQSETAAELATWAGILDSISQGLGREGLTSGELDKFFAEAERIRALANAEVLKLQPPVNELQQQLTELGNVPAEGEPPETEEVKQRRSNLNEQFAKVDADFKAARLAAIRSQQIQRTITQERQTRFFSSISVRNKSTLTPTFWGKYFAGYKSFFRSLDLLFEDSSSIMIREFKRKPWKISVLIFSLALFALIFIRLRRILAPRTEEEVLDGEHDFFSSRFARFCRQGILPVVLIYAIYELFWVLFLLTPRFDRFLAGIIIAGCFYIIALVLHRIILLPNAEGDRVSSITDVAARKISRVITIGLGIGLLFSIMNTTSQVLVSPVEVTMGLSFLFSLTIGAMSILVLWLLYKDNTKRERLLDARRRSSLWTYLNILTWFVSAGIIFAALFGYVALAEFLSQQLVFGLIVIGVAWLFLRSIDGLFAARTEDVQAAVDSATAMASEDAASSQFAILGTGILKLIVYMGAGILLMLPWGYRTSDFFKIFRDLFFGFEVGGLSISISTILLAIGLFFLGYTVTVALRNWLNNKLLPTTKLDIGISNSISTVFGYIGFILAAILGISAAGFDLSNLAIVAGALSVGVGFGLQSIVNNFVSGLILLAERPIKAGDWIVTTGGEGTVKKISVRSTEIETFDRATVIVPNSTLITDNVTNWTHENKTGRIIIPVGVGYNSDPVRVEELLLACAKAHRLVLGRPAPQVFFMDFGANSLDFQLRCFLADVNYSISVSSELRFAILAALREAEIEIPFPQHDVHIRSDDTKRAK